MATEKEKNPVQDEQKKRSNGRQYFNKKPEGERKESLPTLKYGKGNNFYAFQQALYRRALRDYGDLAKLISLNKYYEPTLDLPDFSGMGLSLAEQAIMRQEALKEHSKLITRMKLDRPKLYGLILEHMSVESKDEVAQDADYETWHKATDPEKLWQTIVKTHKVDCVSMGLSHYSAGLSNSLGLRPKRILHENFTGNPLLQAVTKKVIGKSPTISKNLPQKCMNS
jgi:hypothetical protein